MCLHVNVGVSHTHATACFSTAGRQKTIDALQRGYLHDRFGWKLTSTYMCCLANDLHPNIGFNVKKRAELFSMSVLKSINSCMPNSGHAFKEMNTDINGAVWIMLPVHVQNLIWFTSSVNFFLSAPTTDKWNQVWGYRAASVRGQGWRAHSFLSRHVIQDTVYHSNSCSRYDL